jgi:GNAT superfamily N-acetyltransferase
MRTDSLNIRPGQPGDAEVLVNLIRELAVYEKLEMYAQATPEALRQHLFGPQPYAETLVAEVGAEAVGFALYFPTFSTFRGQPGLYLEDLFVRPAYRGRGIGKALMATVARVTIERGFGRLEWSVLDWNAPAIGFYRKLGAQAMDEWTVYRVVGEPLEQLAALTPGAAGGRWEA